MLTKAENDWLDAAGPTEPNEYPHWYNGQGNPASTAHMTASDTTTEDVPLTRYDGTDVRPPTFPWTDGSVARDNRVLPTDSMAAHSQSRLPTGNVSSHYGMLSLPTPMGNMPSFGSRPDGSIPATGPVNDPAYQPSLRHHQLAEETDTEGTKLFESLRKGPPIQVVLAMGHEDAGSSRICGFISGTASDSVLEKMIRAAGDLDHPAGSIDSDVGPIDPNLSGIQAESSACRALSNIAASSTARTQVSLVSMDSLRKLQAKIIKVKNDVQVRNANNPFADRPLFSFDSVSASDAAKYPTAADPIARRDIRCSRVNFTTSSHTG